MIRKVAVITGFRQRLAGGQGACAQLKALDIPFEAHILSAHRTHRPRPQSLKGAKAAGFGVILCAAGMAAHLAGAFAQHHPAGDRHPHEGRRSRWSGCAAVYGADAQRHPGGYCGPERRQECRLARSGDPGTGDEELDARLEAERVAMSQ